MSQTRQNNGVEIHPIIAGRWSPRAFDSNRAVESEKLLSCLEAARWSSSCFGDEPWRFIVGVKNSADNSWQHLFDSLAEGNQVWARHASILILACASDTFSQNGKTNRWSQYDTGQAMMALSLQAVAEGLITHSMGGFNPESLQQAFSIPDGFTLMSVTALGYSGTPETLPDHYQSMEAAERSRKPLQEIALASWNQPWHGDQS